MILRKHDFMEIMLRVQFTRIKQLLVYEIVKIKYILL